MPVIPFGEWKPDVIEYKASSSRNILNVVPRADGYAPWSDFLAYTAALAAACRGFFYARKTDGSIAVFAGTNEARLYQLSNTSASWTDVSKGGSAYSPLPSSDHWQFAQFGNFVIAVQANVTPQYFDLTSSTAFADLSGAPGAVGTPPQARYISVLGRFVVLSGLLSTPYRVAWSGLNAPATWTAGVNSSDVQDFPDGGLVRGVAGGEYGIVFQETVIRRMTFVPGSAVIFAIEKITDDKGLMAPYSIIRAGDRIFFLAPQGFQVIQAGIGGLPQPIGKERFDRTFFGDYDQGAIQLILGAADPAATRVYWAYKSQAGSAGLIDKLIAYDYALDRATTITLSNPAEFLASLARPGITLESLDALAPGIIAVTGAANNGSGAIRLTLSSEVASWSYGQADTTHAKGDPGTINLGNASQNTVEVYGVGGTTEANGSWNFTVVDGTHIDLTGSSFVHAYTSGGSIGGALDALAFSLDDVSSAALSRLSAVSSLHQLGFFSGANLPASVETPEQALDDVRRVRVKGFRPITDGVGVSGLVGTRENLQSAVAYSAGRAVNGKGLVPTNVSTRLARMQLSFPAGASWTYAAGVEPIMTPEGKR